MPVHSRKLAKICAATEIYGTVVIRRDENLRAVGSSNQARKMPRSVNALQQRILEALQAGGGRKVGLLAALQQAETLAQLLQQRLRRVALHRQAAAAFRA